MDSIDLGRKMNVLTSPSPAKDEESKEKYYPSLYIDGVKGISDLPDSGEITVAYRKKESTVRTDKDGEETCSCCLEVTKIIDVEGDEDEEDELTDRENTLDKLADEERSKE